MELIGRNEAHIGVSLCLGSNLKLGAYSLELWILYLTPYEANLKNSYCL